LGFCVFVVSGQWYGIITYEDHFSPWFVLALNGVYSAHVG